jgi:hypothetical protein
MADANRMNLAYEDEDINGSGSYGVTVGTELIDLRFTSESIAQITGTVNSAEIRSDRQIVDHLRTTINVAGDMNIELSYGAFDDFIRWGLQSAAWTTPVVSGVTNGTNDIDAASGDNSFNTAGSFVTDGFDANRWIKASGFSEAGNNTFFRIVTVAATKLVVAGSTLVTDGTDAGHILTQGAEIVNGVVDNSFSLEKEYTDLTNIFSIYTGCMIDSFTLTVPSDNIVTGSFGILGKIEASAAATEGDGGNTAAPANEVMAGIEDITAIMESSVALASTQFSITLSNNLRERMQIGTLGPIGISSGTVDVTGTLQGYFTQVAELDKYLNFSDTALAIQFADSTGKGYVIDLPRVNYSSGTRVAGGVNTDILADLAFSSFRHETQGETIVIQRFAA